jgi:hypothetical protein
MTKPNKFPKNLWPIRDTVIERIHAGKTLPSEIQKIYEWLSNEGWDDLVGKDSNESMIIYLGSFCENDAELRTVFDVEDSIGITDQMRIQFSRDLLSKVISGEDSYDYSTVVFYPLKGNDEKEVIICATLNCQQGGWDVEWNGVFLISDLIFKEFKIEGIYLVDHLDTIDDASILSFWNT